VKYRDRCRGARPAMLLDSKVIWRFLRQISYDFLVAHIIFMSSDSLGGRDGSG
jgi:hypothetical protein